MAQTLRRSRPAQKPVSFVPSLWDRAWALFVDLFFVGLAFSLLEAFGAPKSFSAAFTMLYFALSFAFWSATIGQHVFGFRVLTVASGHQKLGQARGIIRGLLKAVGMSLAFLPLLPLFPGRRSLLDLICGTQALYK